MHPVVIALAALLTQPAQAASGVGAVEWMTGCWATQGGGTRSWESWTRAGDELLLGVSYTIDAAGAVKAFEFMRITSREGRLVYLAQPGGQPATTFTLVPGSSAREATFGNPQHDFPKRVGYRATPVGLLAWIDGGGASARRIEYPMARVPCDRDPAKH